MAHLALYNILLYGQQVISNLNYVQDRLQSKEMRNQKDRKKNSDKEKQMATSFGREEFMFASTAAILIKKCSFTILTWHLVIYLNI